MYRAFFGLGEAPFRITPDPRFLHHGVAVEAALRALTTGILERAGLLVLVGEVGTGKTTLVRQLLESLPGEVRTVLVMHPTVGFDEILDHVLLELGLPVQGGGREALLERLSEFLREHTHVGGNAVVFFDEAQALQDATLDALPALLDVAGADGRPALQIVLAGQPGLETRLAPRAHAALRARIGAPARLGPPPAAEVASYVRARLAHAQAQDLDIFTPEALARVAALSGGVPRIINVLCEAALVAAFADGQRPIARSTIETVWADYAPLHRAEGTPMPRPPAEPIAIAPAVETAPGRRRMVLAAAGVIAVGLLALLATRPWHPPPPPQPPPTPAPAAPRRVSRTAGPRARTRGAASQREDRGGAALRERGARDRRSLLARLRGARSRWTPGALRAGRGAGRRCPQRGPARRQRAGDPGSRGRGQAGRGPGDGAGALPAEHQGPARTAGAAAGRGDAGGRPARPRAAQPLARRG